ncbi:stealth conserved region 3 domain-containing protein [Jannaschia seohaensis]|uniref:Stealth protein CR1, conserved region 1 n=1 Tax=Jannaschia seohaensis TaxID=475081 RepID=A0A2Y9B2S9_9RHOB|nr:stealth conserved region 3 domain-containing protein [Jannaschia seohaensis]PWJ12943.1 Stealth-like protein [Jannaschia seohaensis]SSA50751.1 Stealth protein CR1, conserved region 1 [Jannaschia seohaensis]
MLISEPIDAVVMWVDGSDPAFLASQDAALKAERAKGRKIVVSAARHRDNGELRYTLRALLHNAPWLRRIHIVTNGQVPDWLEFDGDRIRHVTHAEIFPDPEMLPNFNTFAIESCLHRIPGLSETFLRLSDDFFIGRPVTAAEILGAAGTGHLVFHGGVSAKPKTRYQRQIARNADLFEARMGLRPGVNYAHAPQLRSKTLFEAFAATFAEEIAQTRGHRFRDEADIIPLFLYPYFHMMKLRPEAAVEVAQGRSAGDFRVVERIFNKIYMQVLVGGTERDWRGRMRQVSDRRPLFFNVNDQFTKDDYEVELAAMIDFLERMFPDPIPQERD